MKSMIVVSDRVLIMSYIAYYIKSNKLFLQILKPQVMNYASTVK